MRYVRSPRSLGMYVLALLVPWNLAVGATAAQDDDRVLPYSQGRKFATLDSYLRHLRRNGAIDLPYYRLVKPGVYELVSGFRPVPSRDSGRQLYTRRELMRLYGFSR